MSEMIKSALINCFSMLEERSFFSFLLPHPAPPFPHVFPSVSLGSAALQSIPNIPGARYLELPWMYLPISALFFPSWGRNEIWTWISLGEGHKPPHLIQLYGDCGSCHMSNVHRIRHWLSRQTHAWPCALESGSTRQVSDRLPQDLNGFKILIYCLYVCAQEVKILRQSWQPIKFLSCDYSASDRLIHFLSSSAKCT